MQQPITIANITAMSRAQVMNLTGALGFEVANERTSLNNYLTMLRAVNPTRRLGVPGLTTTLLDKAISGVPTDTVETGRGKTTRLKNTLSADTVDMLGRARMATPAGATQWDGSLALALPLIASLSPAVSDGLVLESLITEERLATSGGVRETTLDEVMRSKTMIPMAWHRFFRTAAPHTTEVPVSVIIDPIAMGAYTTGTAVGGDGPSPTASEAYTHLCYFATPGASGLFEGKALSSFINELLRGEAPDDFTSFYNQCLILDFLHCMPRLSAFFAAESMSLVTKDPEQRYTAIARISRLIRFMSLQPVVFYAKCLHDILVHPTVREDITRIHEGFYVSDLWSSFAARCEAVKLGHVYRHLWQDVTSGPATTRFGDTHVLRVPTALQSMFESWNLTIKAVATAGSTKGMVMAQPDVPPSFADNTLFDPTYFMRYFMRLTGPDEIWTPLMSEMTAALGYEAPSAAPAVNYLDPPLVMSDGWSSSAPVDYVAATRSLVVTPVTFRQGGPAKIALTNMAALAPADIALESSVERIQVVQRALSPAQQASVAVSGISVLGSDRPCLWIMRHADAHSLYSKESFVALSGRMPMVMWNGDLDATIVPHTSFEDFAMDLGMSPRGLAALVTDAARGPALSSVSRRARAFVKLFFKRREADDKSPSIFSSDNDYGMGNSVFSSHAYFISARAAVMQSASMVSLAPVWATDSLVLVTREFSAAVARETVAFRTITAEPLQPREHSTALRDVVRLDDAIASAWGASLANPTVR